MAALPGYKASIYATTTPSVAFTNEAMTDAGDHQTFTVVAAAKRYWDQATALTVQTTTDGTTWTTTTAYTTAMLGVIVLTTALVGASPGCRVSGNYLPYSVIGDATQVEINNTLDIMEATSFVSAAAGWKTKIPTLVGAEFKLDRWWVDTLFLNVLATNTRLVIVAYSGANANQRYEAFCFIKQDALKFAINALITESLSFDIDGQVSAHL
jgi:hypothetical protein